MIYEIWAGIVLAALTLFGLVFLVAIVLSIIQVLSEKHDRDLEQAKRWQQSMADTLEREGK